MALRTARRISHEREKKRLRVRCIRYSSPGVFSFNGLGAVVQQFRELVKDLWYRNKQETDLGQLELLERYLRIRRENPDVDLLLTPELIRAGDTIDAANGSFENLKRLEHEGKLLSPPESLGHDPSSEETEPKRSC
jgi:hypothetical protein